MVCRENAECGAYSCSSDGLHRFCFSRWNKLFLEHSVPVKTWWLNNQRRTGTWSAERTLSGEHAGVLEMLYIFFVFVFSCFRFVKRSLCFSGFTWISVGALLLVVWKKGLSGFHPSLCWFCLVIVVLPRIFSWEQLFANRLQCETDIKKDLSGFHPSLCCSRLDAC